MGGRWEFPPCEPREGILPTSQSTVFRADFPIVAHGEAYDDCGNFFTVGCLDAEKHRGITLDGVDFTNKVYLEVRKKSCHRAVCPICWGDWASREVKNAKRRLDSFVLRNRPMKPIHLIVSVSEEDYGLSLQEMRKKVYRVLKRVHCLGGMMNYHPKRYSRSRGWYFSPHFHVIGYGWIVHIRQNYVKSGYVVRNKGIRNTVEGTIWYQLSHAGVHPKFHTVTWFGALSYNKLKIKRVLDKERKNCPLCGNRLRRVEWIGEGDCPFHAFEGGAYYGDPKNWIYKIRDQGGGACYEGAIFPKMRHGDRAVLPKSPKWEPPIVEHTVEAIRERNPIMREWMIHWVEGCS